MVDYRHISKEGHDHAGFFRPGSPVEIFIIKVVVLIVTADTFIGLDAD